MRQKYMAMIDKPTKCFTGQSVGFFVVAVGETIHNFATIAEWKGFYLTAAVWVCISALVLSKVLRDWNYADIYRGLPPEDRAESFSKISNLCKGSIEFRVFVWFSMVLSCFLLCGVVWTWDDKSVKTEAKGFITVCALWAEGSTFQLCKMIRDYRERLTWKDSENLPFQFLVVFSCLVAHIAIFLALSTHKLENWQRMHLVSAWGLAVTTVFLVSRHVKDRLDIFKLMAPPETGLKHQEGACDNYANHPSVQFSVGGSMQYPMGMQSQQYIQQHSMQYAMGMQSQQYVQHHSTPDGMMVQYDNQHVEMQHGRAQYQQYELERHYALQDRQHNYPQQFDGHHMAIADRGQQSPRTTARDEQGGYHDNDMLY